MNPAAKSRASLLWRRVRQALAACVLAALTLTACGEDAADGEAHVQTLPNSLADTSAHVAERAIPSYGPAGLPPATDSSSSSSSSSRAAGAVRGQVLYVPVYSHIFHRSADREIALAATLSIRNTSPTQPIHIREVDYFNSEGTLLESYLDATRNLGPLASTYVVIEEEDLSGGVGANFIVEWVGDGPTTPPLVETVMISTASSQGISLTSEARVIQEW